MGVSRSWRTWALPSRQGIHYVLGIRLRIATTWEWVCHPSVRLLPSNDPCPRTSDVRKKPGAVCGTMRYSTITTTTAYLGTMGCADHGPRLIPHCAVFSGTPPTCQPPHHTPDLFQYPPLPVHRSAPTGHLLLRNCPLHSSPAQMQQALHEKLQGLKSHRKVRDVAGRVMDHGSK